MTPPICEICGEPATCFGAYENPDSLPGYACDRCCGHGNEDGWCKPILDGGVHDALAWLVELSSRVNAR